MRTWTRMMDEARRWRVYATCAKDEGDRDAFEAAVALHRECLKAARALAGAAR